MEGWSRLGNDMFQVGGGRDCYCRQAKEDLAVCLLTCAAGS